MPEQPKRPFPLLVCGAMIHLASRLVPSVQRQDWKREWQAEIWHRWQFLWHNDSWNNREATLLLQRCAGAFPDALWHLTGQAEVQARFREWVRSPWTCLGSLAAGLVLLAIVTGGLPAARQSLRIAASSTSSRLVYIWFHPSAGGGDEGLPPDVAPAWASRSRLLEKVAPFVIGHRVVTAMTGNSMQPLVVKTRASLFDVLDVRPSLGHFSQNSGVVITDSLWKSLFKRDPGVIGKKVRIGREWQQVSAVLPTDFSFLSRQPAAYLIEPFLPDAQSMVVGRIKRGVSEKQLDKELTHIAEVACYYYFRSELRYSFVNEMAWIPFKMFVLAALASTLLVLAVSRVSLRRMRFALSPQNRKSLPSRTSFFSAKLTLAFLLVLLSALEWSRSQSAVLYGSRDPASGPFLLWLYILGTMGVLFWAVADQRARCRVCLRLLCFPVRIGCPGCLLLDWSGTELLCSEGHGMLHVPHMAPSWDEESEHWIALDESWKDLFAEAK